MVAGLRESASLRGTLSRVEMSSCRWRSAFSSASLAAVVSALLLSSTYLNTRIGHECPIAEGWQRVHKQFHDRI